MNITTKVSKVKPQDKFKLRRDQFFKLQFRNALYFPDFAAMIKQNSLVVLRTLIRYCLSQNVKMTVSNANVSESLGF